MVNTNQERVKESIPSKTNTENEVQGQFQSQFQNSMATMSGNTKDARNLDYNNTDDVLLLRERISQLEQELINIQSSNNTKTTSTGDTQIYKNKLVNCATTISNLNKENEILLQELESAHSNIQLLVVEQTELKKTLFDYTRKLESVKKQVEITASNDEFDGGLEGNNNDTINKTEMSFTIPPTIEDCKLLIDKMDKYYKLQQENATDIIRDYQVKFIESSQLLQQKNQLISRLEDQIKDLIMIQEQEEQISTDNKIYLELYNDLSTKHETLKNSYLILSHKFQQMFNELSDYKNLNTKNNNSLKIIKLEQMLIDKSNEFEIFMMNNPNLIKEKLIDNLPTITTTIDSSTTTKTEDKTKPKFKNSNSRNNIGSSNDESRSESSTNTRKRRFEIVGMKNEYRNISSSSDGNSNSSSSIGHTINDKKVGLES